MKNKGTVVEPTITPVYRLIYVYILWAYSYVYTVVDLEVFFVNNIRVMAATSA